MKTVMRHGVGVVTGLAAMLVALGWPPVGHAAEIHISDPSEAPFLYTECYAADDLLHPGPAAHFGEDVCVDYEAVSDELVQFNDNPDGTTDVHWALFQHGTATVYVQVDNALLYQGPFRVEEIAQDVGDDADCVWTAFKGGDDQHTWLGACVDPFNGLDFLKYSLELLGETPFFYEALVSGPGTWCAFYSGGQQYGGCL